jgi:hypothetical protein
LLELLLADEVENYAVREINSVVSRLNNNGLWQLGSDFS